MLLSRVVLSLFPNYPTEVMGTPGPLELIIIFAVVLLLFGAKRIPEIARGIGKGIREFKDATSEISRELEAEGQKRQINQPQTPQQGTPQSRQPQQAGQPQTAQGGAAANSASAPDTQESESQESDAPDAKEAS